MPKRYSIAKARSKRVRFGQAYRRFLKTHELSEVGLKRSFAKSVRDRDTGRKVEL